MCSSWHVTIYFVYSSWDFVVQETSYDVCIVVHSVSWLYFMRSYFAVHGRCIHHEMLFLYVMSCDMHNSWNVTEYSYSSWPMSCIAQMLLLWLIRLHLDRSWDIDYRTWLCKSYLQHPDLSAMCGRRLWEKVSMRPWIESWKHLSNPTSWRRLN